MAGSTQRAAAAGFPGEIVRLEDVSTVRPMSLDEVTAFNLWDFSPIGGKTRS